MKQRPIILYIPGLGDHNLRRQQQALGLWRFHRVDVEIVPMKWLEDEPWNTKLQRLLNRIDFYAKQGRTVSLVGVSAGSTATLQALAQRRIAVSKIALVCPKFQYPEAIHPLRFQMNPAFKDAITTTVSILPSLTEEDRAKIKVYRPIWDNLLPGRESYIPGVKNKIMPAITHVGGIAYAITFGSSSIIRFLRKAI